MRKLSFAPFLLQVMKLNEKALEDFKKMYKEFYKLELTNDEAQEYGTRLILLVAAIHGKDLSKLTNN